MVLSVILPVYNIEKYVIKCIYSILDFTTPEMLIEIIAINDGSTDNSLEELLTINDSRLKVIDQVNTGVSGARNKGLSEASGAYVWFIDPDDYLEDHFISKIYELLLLKSPEMLLFGINWVDGHKNIGSRVYSPGEYTVPEIMDMQIYDSNVWSRVIKKEILDNHNITFINVVNGEDFEFCIKVFCYVNKVIIPEEIGYNYLLNPNGSSKRRDKSHLEKLASHSVKTLISLQADFNKIEEKAPNKPVIFEPWINNYLFGLFFSLYRFNYEIDFTKKIIDTLGQMERYPIATNGIGIKQKMFVLLVNSKFLFLCLMRLKRLF